MYRCCFCGLEFEHPRFRRWNEARPDGFREPFCQAVCPVCGAEETEFEEVIEDDESGKRGELLHPCGG